MQIFAPGTRRRRSSLAILDAINCGLSSGSHTTGHFSKSTPVPNADLIAPARNIWCFMDYFVPFAEMQSEAQYAVGPILLLIWHCSMSTLDKKMLKIFKASCHLWMRWKLVANHLYIFYHLKILACVGVYEVWAGQAIVSQCKLCRLTMIDRDLF